MALEAEGLAALALHRFGFGPRPGSIEAVAANPKAALLAELDVPSAALLRGTFQPTDVSARAFFKEFQSRRAAQRAEGEKDAVRRDDSGNIAVLAQKRTDQIQTGGAEKMGVGDEDAKAKHKLPIARQIYLDEAQARIDAALEARTGLIERLVWFWSNHFCISATMKGVLPAIAGSFEREAIRPHVLGRFSDMLLAVESHPAMLTYLDNRFSIGPNSPAGRHRGKSGLNENLARETLELHTLGVRTVYTQSDVTSFAKVITGWTIVPFGRPDGGRFEFRNNWHEPGSQTVVGKSYPDTGVEQGRAVLRDIGRHPATAHHIATKLVTHFVADDPPKPLIDQLARRFSETGGDLKAVTAALLNAPEGWEAPRKKLRRPSEWIISAFRAVDAPAHVEMIVRAQDLLGEPLWKPPAPKGFSDESAPWMDGIATRLNVANNFAAHMQLKNAPKDVLAETLGPLASSQTKDTIERAADNKQALALLFLAPEFLMR
jgi:uncharacterized protein (DUF1800 family)